MTISLRRSAAAAALAVATTVLVSTGSQPAAAATKAPTKATISYVGGVFKLKVASPRLRCKAGRVAYIVLDAGDEAEIEKVRTNNRGVFRVTAELPPGRITTFVPKTRRCQLAQSNTLKIEGPGPV